MLSKLKQWAGYLTLRRFCSNNSFPVQCKFEVGDTVLHVKTNRLYRIALVPTRLVIENALLPAYAYEAAQKQDGKSYRLWVRPRAEMEDGRFVLVSKFNSND